MSTDERYTDKLDETIYAFIETDNEEEINKKLTTFFKELVTRKRDDPFEGGIQAVIIILEDKCAMKVCERDGIGPHTNSAINLVKYLNNDHKYLSIIGTGLFKLSTKERNQIAREAVEARILDGKEELMFAINSKVEEKSEFQIEILNKIINLCKTLKDNNTYKKVEIGVHTPKDDIEFEDLTDKHYENIITSLTSQIKNKTKN